MTHYADVRNESLARLEEATGARITLSNKGLMIWSEDGATTLTYRMPTDPDELVAHMDDLTAFINACLMQGTLARVARLREKGINL